MKLGLIGLPNSGKTCLFNAMTNSKSASSGHLFSTKEAKSGIVSVPDERLEVLAKMYNPLKITYATIEFVDIAGLVRGSSKGEGLGNKFLADIRDVDAVLHIVRFFKDDNIMHIDGSVNPMRDVETVNLELILSDLDIVERRLERAKKAFKADKRAAVEIELCEKLISAFENGNRAATSQFSDDEKEILKEIPLLSIKPVIYVANIGENELDGSYEQNPDYIALKEFAKSENSKILTVCASLEEEISKLSADEKEEFMRDFGIEKSGLEQLIKESYDLLGLISFLTAGTPEVRAWTIRKGMSAPKAAGKIHSDLERGFIRAETVAYDDLIKCGSYNAAKEKGLVRSEGKDYIVKDGDIMLIRFNV